MNEGLPNTKEKFNIKVEIAKPEDLEVLRELRLFAVKSKDGKLLGATPKNIEEDESMSDEEWSKKMFGNDRFTILARIGSDAVGMSRAFKKTDKWWHMGWAYIKDDFRHQGIDRKMTGLRLFEIKNRGGEKVTAFIKKSNISSINNCKYFGFKKINTITSSFSINAKLEIMESHLGVYELNLNNPEVIKKINEIVDAG